MSVKWLFFKFSGSYRWLSLGLVIAFGIIVCQLVMVSPMTLFTLKVESTNIETDYCLPPLP